MTSYEVVYIFTNTIYLLTIYNLFDIFFDDDSCCLKERKIVYILYFIVLSVVFFISRLPVLTLIINMTFLFLISLCYKSSFQKKLFSISFIYSTGILIEIIASIFFGFFELSGLREPSFNSISVLIFTRVFTLIVVYLIKKYTIILKKDYPIPKIYYLEFFVILFGTLYLFITQLTNDDITLSHIMISGFVLILVNVTIIIIDEKIYTSIIIEYRQKTLKQHNDALENQMELLYQSSEAIRILKHDFKNHLVMLSNLYKNGHICEIDIYIHSLLGDIDNQVIANSNNFVIDSILNFKLNSIKTSDIKINLDLSVPVTINILAHDLTAIITNLLDNAITACEKSKEKTLDIKINCNVGNLIILINNSYNGRIIEENGMFKTTNIFGSNHGFGIKSVKHILKKYDGDFRTDYTSNMFYVSVIIPY